MLAKDLLDTYSKNKQFISELVKIDNIVKKRNSSKLGYNWNIIFSLVTIIVLSLVFNKGFFKGDNYLLYLSLNFFLWQMISSILSNSIKLYEYNANFLLNNNINFLIFNIKNCIIFFKVYLKSCILILVFSFYYKVNFIFTLISFGSLFLIIINIFLFSVFISIITTRLKQFENYFNLFILLLFYFTPIIWSEKILSNIGLLIIKFNPLYHFFKIYNFPMLNGYLGKEYLLSIIVCLILTLINFIICNLIYKKEKKTLKNYL